MSQTKQKRSDLQTVYQLCLAQEFVSHKFNQIFTLSVTCVMKTHDAFNTVHAVDVETKKKYNKKNVVFYASRGCSSLAVA